MNKRIGLLGGTFDPIHLGHLHLALCTAKALDLQEVRLIPNANPLLRHPPLANSQQRFEMLQLAIENHPLLTIDESEIRRNGPSYTIDTVRAIRKEYDSLCYIMGIDQFSQFNHWHQWQSILDYVHIIVTNRGGFELKPNPDIEELLQQHEVFEINALNTKPNGFILQQYITPLTVSATEIRKEIIEGQTPEVYLPEKVWNYIEANGLYRKM